jgi:hypothetical protein
MIYCEHLDVLDGNSKILAIRQCILAVEARDRAVR